MTREELIDQIHELDIQPWVKVHACCVAGIFTDLQEAGVLKIAKFYVTADMELRFMCSYIKEKCAEPGFELHIETWDHSDRGAQLMSLQTKHVVMDTYLHFSTSIKRLETFIHGFMNMIPHIPKL